MILPFKMVLKTLDLSNTSMLVQSNKSVLGKKALTYNQIDMICNMSHIQDLLFISDKILANFLFDPYARPNTKLTGIRMEMGRGKNSVLTLKAPSKIAADGILIFFCLSFSKKIWLDISCESSAKQGIHMKSRAIFSTAINKKKKNFVC
ncbi:MAG: hypothetical protein AB2693_03810 [Candidatus Thiodiazotropha sp.]